MKKIAIITGIVLAAIGIGIWSYYSNKIYYNEPNAVGNTAGNLYNGGYFCEIDDTIFFANPMDDGTLYSMSSDCTDVKKLSTDKVAYINADPHYVYYTRQNYAKSSYTANVLDYHKSGVYRMNRSNNDLAVLYDGISGALCLAGNTVYYQHYDDQTAIQLYRVDIDKKNAGRVNTDAPIPAAVRNGYLYYAGVMDDTNLHALNLANDNSSVVSGENVYMPIAMNTGIYYISPHNKYRIYKLSYTGGEPQLIVDEFCSSFNITEDERIIFYQIDGGDDNRIAAKNLSTGMVSTIADGNYKQIHVTSKYVFFTDFGGAKTYAYSRTGNVLSLFRPPVDNKKK